MSDETQVVGEVAGAAKEFFGMCRDTLGVFTEPLKIKRNAKAQAEAITIIKQAELRADREEFAQRALFRFLGEQMYNQENLETILSGVPKLLTPGIDPRKVSEDWLHRFAESAQKCSEKELQTLWAKIMAEEVNSPSSISHRTIEQVRLFDKSDALLIEKIAPYVISGGNISFVISNQEKLWEDLSISYLEWTKLQDIGILQSSMSTFNVTQDEPLLLGNCGLLYGIENTQDLEKSFNIYLLTNFGRELITTLKTKKSVTEYLKKIKDYIGSLKLNFNYLSLVKTYTNGFKIYCIDDIN